MDLLSSLGFVKRETALKTVWLCVFTAINSDCVSVMLKTSLDTFVPKFAAKYYY